MEDYAEGRRKQGERPREELRGSAVFAAPQNHRLVARIPKPPGDQNRPRLPYKRTSLYHLPLFRRGPLVAKYRRNAASSGEKIKTSSFAQQTVHLTNHREFPNGWISERQ